MHHKLADINSAWPTTQFKKTRAVGVRLGRGFYGDGATRDPHVLGADSMLPAVIHSTLRIRKEIANALIPNKQ